MDNAKKEELMDKYASGTLNHAELNEIEQMLGSNPEFQNELNMRKNISDSVNIVGNRELRKLLNKLHGEVVEDKPKAKGNGVLKKVVIALVAILAIGLAIYLLGFFNRNTDVRGQTIQFASYYEPELSASRSNDGIQNDYLPSLAAAYKSEDYDKVIAIAQPHLAEGNDEVILVAAIAALEEENTTMAMDLLNRLLTTENYYYTDHANWFKALGYLQMGDKSSAKAILLKLSNDSKADHHTDAKELLEKI